MVEQVTYAIVVGILYFLTGVKMETTPDSWFWYGLSILLAGTLIGIIWRFANKISDVLEEVRKIVYLHEHDISRIKEDHKEMRLDINDLKKRR